MTIYLFPLILAYIIGSLNFSIILLRLTKNQDPRNYGSKNAGTTNVYRQSGIVLATMTLFLDIGRSALTTIIAYQFVFSEHLPLICFGIVLGNCFPCFHNFSGGKGVANYLGFAIAISPLSAFISMIVWCLTFLVSRTSFISSLAMISVLCTGMILSFKSNIMDTITILLIYFLVVCCHKSNITKFHKKC